MRLLYTDGSYAAAGRVRDFRLSMDYGEESDNDFELVTRAGVELPAGCLVYVPGTGYGGLVRDPCVLRSGKVTQRIWRGPTWSGLLAQRVLRPDPGADYLTVSGELSRALSSILSRVGLSSLMEAGPATGASVSNHQFARYADAYAGLRAMLLAKGYRLGFSREATGRTVVSAVPCSTYVDDSAGRFGFAYDRLTPPNHLVCLGQGDLRDRTVIDLYADARGNVSATQTITGLAEVVQTYENSSCEDEELREEGVRTLKELQVFSSLSVDLPEGGGYDVGDLVGVRDYKTGVGARARITGVTVEADGTWDKPQVTLTCGEPEDL